MRAAGNDQADVWVALQRDRIGGIFRADVHLQLEIDELFSAACAAGNLVDACGLSWLDRQVFRLHTLGGDFGLDRFGNFVDGKVQAVRNHRDGFWEADVLDHACFYLGAEFVFRHAGADFFLQGKAALAAIHNAHRFSVLDALGNGSERDDQLVHHEAGVDTRADQGDAPIFRGLIQLRGQLWIGAERIGEFFAGGDDTGLGFEASEQLIHYFGQRRRCRVNYDVGGLFEDFFCVGGNFHAPGSVGRADHFAEVAADFGGVGINGADDFNGLLLSHEARDGCADRPHAVLDYTNLLLHDFPRRLSPRRAAHDAHFGLKRNLYLNGIRERIQRSTLAGNGVS